MGFFVRCCLFLYCFLMILLRCRGNDILGCGGFVKSHASIDFSKIEIGLYTKQGSLKEKTECAPTNGYYFLPLYEKGEYVLKVHPPKGWSFEPSEVALNVDGVTDSCSTGRDVNFDFNGFGITGKVVTFQQNKGPSGISVQLVNENGETRQTTTTEGGDFHFTPVIPGKYTVKASHPRWKLEPSMTTVQVTEGNTALPLGALAVLGYDVRGTVISGLTAVSGVYVVLYSQKDNPTLRVQGCNTALLHGVSGSPICHSVTDKSGTFSFGLVPSGEYYLLTLTSPPGQIKLSYNVKPERVNVSVQHDSIFISNAFEITGFTVVGAVTVQPNGKGMNGIRVNLNGQAIGVSDAAGKYTLAALQAGTYTLTYSAENCEFAPNQLVIGAEGSVSLPEVSPERWRVCGAVTPSAAALSPDKVHTVTIRHERDQYPSINVHSDPSSGGKWCAFLHPGLYIANVVVSDQERRDGLQFFPLSQKVSVGRAPVDGVVFSQLKAKIRGAVKCKEDGARFCADLKVSLRPLSPDGSYVGKPIVTHSKGGVYEFSEVLPGSMEVSVDATRLCWRSARHNVAVTAAEASVPDFVHTGYNIIFTASHTTQVSYESGTDKGELVAEAGVSQHCVAKAGAYTFRPRGCRLYQPEVVHYDTAQEDEPIELKAVSAAAGVRVVSTDNVDDLMLRVEKTGVKDFGPLQATKTADNTYVYEHTLYLALGEFAVVSVRSNSLLVRPATPQQLAGTDECRAAALVLTAVRGLTLAGRIDPPVPETLVVLLADGEEVSRQTSAADGSYRFGPLDAAPRYLVRAEKASYAFAAPDTAGVIRAHKLAEINARVVDDADGKPLQGALVSVSGGDYRRNLATGADGRLTFPSLAPADYFVKPLMKEYKFSPAHKILHVAEGNTYNVTLRGVRVAWSGAGRLLSLGGIGVGGATVVATPTSGAGACSAEEAQTEEHTGAFRLRGLLPGCVYNVALKPPTGQQVGFKLANLPVTLKLSDPPKDIEEIRLLAVHPSRLTDVSVLVTTPNVDHYKTLKLKLAPEDAQDSPIYSTKLDATGYSQTLNPGLTYVLPRLAADGRTYRLSLETAGPHAPRPHYFVSDGTFKHFTIEYTPKLRSSEQELSQTSLFVLPLLIILGFGLLHRERLLATLAAAGERLSDRILHAASTKPPPAAGHHQLLDEREINHIVKEVNAVSRRGKSRKVQ